MNSNLSELNGKLSAMFATVTGTVNEKGYAVFDFPQGVYRDNCIIVCSRYTGSSGQHIYFMPDGGYQSWSSEISFSDPSLANKNVTVYLAKII